MPSSFPRARTPIGKAYRGAFNLTHSPTLLGHAIRHAVLRAGIEPDRIEDAVIGSVLNAGTAGNNVARQGVLAAGLLLRSARKRLTGNVRRA